MFTLTQRRSAWSSLRIVKRFATRCARITLSDRRQYIGLYVYFSFSDSLAAEYDKTPLLLSKDNFEYAWKLLICRPTYWPAVYLRVVFFPKNFPSY